jgi:hypothetical protein
MVVDRDVGGGSYANLSDRDRRTLRDGQIHGWNPTPQEQARIHAAVGAVPAYTGSSQSDEEEYELTVLDQLRMTHPAELVPSEPSVRYYLAAARRARSA